ncbi:MAG: ABC transporter substrate-binding protein [Oscillospiraceae bacterium]|nr:ABC transporter substrate-binding protein [Oscillospiraceae bacterium]
MYKSKKIIAAFTSVLLAACICSCNSSSDSSSTKDVSPQTRQELASLAAKDERLTGELENKTIKWMANWNLNTDSNIERVVFQERYGGNIEETIVDWDSRYEKLAAAINSDEGIDFFSAGDFDAFPKGAIKSMFIPVDDYIDYDSELWKDVKAANDKFTWNGEHYVICVNVNGGNTAVIYNKKTIEEYGLDDPADLYEQGKWDWDSFKRLLSEFVDTDNGLYGIDGYWTEAALSLTTGVPYIGLKDGKLVNNLRDKNLERVQNYMTDLYNAGYVMDKEQFQWKDMPSFVGEGKELFYPCGLWALYKSSDQWKKTFGEEAFFVPMPKDPQADTYYIPSNIDGYLMVSGGHNPDGVVKYANCKRATLLNKDLNKVGEQMCIDSYGWTQEMLDMRANLDKLAADNPVFDFYMGVSSDVADTLDSGETGIRASLQHGTSWAETVSACYNVIDALVEDANNSK